MVENDLNGLDLEDSDEGESEGFDIERVRELGGFVVRATRRRLKLALATFVVIASVGVTAAATMPRTYAAEVKLLAQRGSVLRTLSNSNPGMDSVDNPTKNVGPMIMGRDNLMGLVKDAHLAERFSETRPPALRLKDQLFAKFFGSPSLEDRQLQMALTLESKVTVAVSDDSIVDISVDWSNPQIAYDLVVLVEKNFLEARYDSDVAAINESITILDEHAKNELAIVDAELADYQKVVAARVVAPAAMPAPGVAAPAARSYVSYARSGSKGAGTPTTFIVDPDITKALEEKRARIRALEDQQQRSIDAVRQQLNQAELTLTPMHPTVITLQQRVAAMSEPSPELLQLRSEEHGLMAQIVPPKPAPVVEPMPAANPGSRTTATASAEPSADVPPPLPASTFGAAPDGPLQLAQSKLEAAIRTYQEAASRSDAARVELDITRAAYKHRYTVYTPPEVPRKPKKATAQLVGVGSVVGALLLALLLAAAADLGTGRVLEPWQIRRRLKLDILGELDNPS